MNITDVGHLVSDADEGEDKMLIAARREGKSSYDIAKFYTDIFFNHCEQLHIKKPDIVCKATDHISQMIELISRLEKNGIAYKSGGNVYFDVSKFKNYGALAKLDLESLQSGARIEVDSKKRNPLDFVLWFTQSKFDNQEMQWDSPWGRGYPGWHIECSAMSMCYLGETFDIHCGGIDHIPVHHTNEIAQAEGATEKPFVNIWMHGAFLVDKSQKMSKSSGEFLTLDRFAERGFDPMSYRLFCYSANYRQELSWSWEALQSAQNALNKLRNSVLALKKNSGPNTKEISDSLRNHPALKEFEQAMFNDLGVAKAIAVVYKVIDDKDLASDEKLSLLSQFDKILALGIDDWKETIEDIPANVLELANAREQARKEKNWNLADSIRDQLLQLGYVVEDSKDGPKVKGK
jgi:cysteinyl-tRNA synthetase